MVFNKEDDSGMEELVAYLKTLPLDATIEWGDHSSNAEFPYNSGWVDILVPELLKLLNWRWIWTIKDPNFKEDWEEETPDWTIQLDPDVVIHGIWDEEIHWYKNEQALDLDSLPDPEFMEQKGYCGRPGWTYEVINGALSAWCSKYANRADIKFVHSDDIEDPEVNKAKEEIERIKSGEEEGYVIYIDPQTGYQLQVTESVMDTLLEDPDLSADVVEKMKEIISSFSSNKDAIFTLSETTEEEAIQLMQERIEDVVNKYVHDGVTEEELEKASLEVLLRFNVPLKISLDESDNILLEVIEKEEDN